MDKIVKIVCIVLAIIMLISVLPAFALCFGIFPSPGDDYTYSVPLIEGLRENGFIAYFTTPFTFAAERYMNWQGSIVTCMIYALNPIAFSLDFYRVSMLLHNILFVFAVIVFCNTILSKGYGIKKHISFLIASTLVASFYHCVPYDQLFEMCYWFTGSVYYFMAISFLLLYISSLFNLNTKVLSGESKKITMVWLVLLTLFLGFSNLTTSISIWSGFTMLLALAIITKHRLKRDLTKIYILLTICVAANALCPGYTVRYEHGIEQEMVDIISTSIKDIMILSFKMGTENIRSYATISPVIGMCLLATPFILGKEKQRKYINPILLFIVTYLILIAQYAPFLYALGNKVYGRIVAYRFFTTQVFIMINYINFVCFVDSKIEFKKFLKGLVTVCFIAVGSFFLYHAINVMVIPRSHIKNMIVEYQSGKTMTFIEEQNERMRIFNDDSIKDVELKPLTYKATTFGYDKINNNKDSLVNKNIARFYDKNYVVVVDDK